MSQQPNTFNFGGMAGSYDDWYNTRLGRTYDALEKNALARMLPDAMNANRLLDVGCGTGHWSAFFSTRGFEVTGVDIAPEMIAAARAKRITNASFQVADAHALPFHDGRFDVTAAITTLEFVRDSEAVLREMARCTSSPGGTILVGVLNALATVNIERQKGGTPPYADARFFSPEQVKAVLAPFGKARVAVTTFLPRRAAALSLAPLTDFLGRLLHGRRGAFLVGRALR